MKNYLIYLLIVVILTSFQQTLKTDSDINKIVYVGSMDGNLYALDATSGQKKWSYSTGPISYHSPIVAEDIVYVVSYDNLFAIDENGKKDGVLVMPIKN